MKTMAAPSQVTEKFVGVLCAGALLLFAAPAIAGTQIGSFGNPPKTPAGLSRCHAPLAPSRLAVGRRGELFQYRIEMLGIGLGTVNVTTARRGLHRGAPVTEYRAWVEPASMISGILHLEGRVASLVPDGSFTPVSTLLEYRFRSKRYRESQSFSRDGSVVVERRKNGKDKTYRRDFDGPVLDFLSAFNMVRRLPTEPNGCVVFYNDGRAYTAWIEKVGSEQIKVAGKKRSADRYRVRYASEKSKKKIEEMKFWLSPGEERFIYRAEASAGVAPKIELTGYSSGR